MGDINYQHNDFEPGIEESGLVWTIPLAESSMVAQPHLGSARYRAHDLSLGDYHSFANSFGGPAAPFDPAHTSFEVRWTGGGTHRTIHDTTYGFEGEFVEGPISITFTATNEKTGLTYTSVADEEQTTVGGGVGRERNGIFFS